MPGARNSQRDAAELREDRRKAGEVVAHIEAAGVGEEEEVPEEGKSLLLGDAVKSLGNGKIGGYLVRFSGPDQPDLVGDFFTSDTDFGEMGTTNVLYHHGQDPALKTRSIGTGTLTKDKVGIWIEAQLKMADAYEEAIWNMVKQGKLRWSSGTAPHLVEREPVGKAMWIKNWPLRLDASLTPTAAEFRNLVIEMKSGEHLMDPNTEKTTPETGAAPPPAAPVAPQGPPEWAAEMQETIKALQERNATLEQQIEAVKDSAPAVKSGGYAAQGNEVDERYVKAFSIFLRTGDASGVKAAMEEGTDNRGGYLVPGRYSNDVIAALTYDSIMRRAGARVIQVDGTDSFNVPTMTHSARAVIQSAEGVAADQKEPTVGQITFSPVTFTRLSKASMQVVQDSRIDIMSQILQPDFTQAFAAGENYWFVNGDGTATTQPQGILDGASNSSVTTATASTISADNIIDSFYALKDLYRNRATWLMNDSTVKAIRKLKDTTGQYLWQQSLQAGEPNTILGRPVFTMPDMPELGTATNKVIIFGDLSYFWIADFMLGQMGIEMLDQLYKENLQIGYLGYRRIDSRVILSEAIKYVAAGS